MTEVANQRYETLLQRMTDLLRNGVRQNIERAYKLGLMYREFTDGMIRNKYGDATVEKLCTDLQSRGVLGEYSRPDKYLYVAKVLVDMFPDLDELNKLVDHGFSLSHAKRLFSLDEQTRTKVQSRMIEHGRVISVVRLEDLCREVGSKQSMESIRHVVGESDDPSADVPESRFDCSPAPVDTKSAHSSAGAAAPAEQPQSKPQEKTATSKTNTIPERSIKSPLKAVKTLERQVSKSVIAMADAVIAVKETAKIGFDSDIAQDRYLKELSNLRVALSSFLEAAPALCSLIDSERGAADIPTDK